MALSRLLNTGCKLLFGAYIGIDRRSCRLKYKNKLMEWTVELLWPTVMLAVGMFASISALTIVGQD